MTARCATWSQVAQKAHSLQYGTFKPKDTAAWNKQHTQLTVQTSRLSLAKLREQYKSIATSLTAQSDLPMDIDGKALTGKSEQLKIRVIKFIVDHGIAELKKDEAELQDQWEGVCQEFGDSLVEPGQDVAIHSEGIDKAIRGAIGLTNGMQLAFPSPSALRCQPVVMAHMAGAIATAQMLLRHSDEGPSLVSVEIW